MDPLVTATVPVLMKGTLMVNSPAPLVRVKAPVLLN
jgi:hypothetical protein